MTCGGLETIVGEPNPPRHDTANFGTTFTYRGNLTYTTGLSGSMCTAYKITGVPYKKRDGAGREVAITTSSTTAYSLPSVLTPNSDTNLSTSVSYTSFFAVASAAGPNGVTTSTSYDTYGRASSSTSADGATVNYTYTYNPNTVKATVGGGTDARWTKTTLDGFGRTLKAESGHGSDDGIGGGYGVCGVRLCAVGEDEEAGVAAARARRAGGMDDKHVRWLRADADHDGSRRERDDVFVPGQYDQSPQIRPVSGRSRPPTRWGTC